ncbi:hypothetical protein C8N43_2214 [Litoreibacter ponti]|uniref:Uncharacterized protein n=1 Tax=Litoreibacter ponti TaxID=1510457 RepID=A0A2T6BND0_9RHOB|nr:hypothetical protein [Litoreibacter ponti]PTX57544.1 hypothetical protein C8N43_2214 [Litoreibacter ponti]
MKAVCAFASLGTLLFWTPAQASYTAACILSGTVTQTIIDESPIGAPPRPPRAVLRVTEAKARFEARQGDHDICQQFSGRIVQFPVPADTVIPAIGDRRVVSLIDFFDQDYVRRRTVRLIAEKR